MQATPAGSCLCACVRAAQVCTRNSPTRAATGGGSNPPPPTNVPTAEKERVVLIQAAANRFNSPPPLMGLRRHFYGVITADPASHFSSYTPVVQSHNRHDTEKHYRTMSLAALLALPVRAAVRWRAASVHAAPPDSKALWRARPQEGLRL